MLFKLIVAISFTSLLLVHAQEDKPTENIEPTESGTLAYTENDHSKSVDKLIGDFRGKIRDLFIDEKEGEDHIEVPEAIPENPKPVVKYCEPYEPDDESIVGIEIINLTSAMNLIAKYRNISSALSSNATDDGKSAVGTTKFGGRCVAIYIFARWCSFSAAIAPYMSALAKSFSSCCMKFVALDAADDIG